jgi:hypothetical protein
MDEKLKEGPKGRRAGRLTEDELKCIVGGLPEASHISYLASLITQNVVSPGAIPWPLSQILSRGGSSSGT